MIVTCLNDTVVQDAGLAMGLQVHAGQVTHAELAREVGRDS